MSNFPQSRPWELDYGTDNKVVFNFFNAVYAWMAVGLAVTAAVSYAVSQSSLVYATGGRAFAVIFMLGAALLAFAVRGVALRLSATAATVLFLVYAACIGGAIAPIFLIYNLSTIGAAFLMTGGLFGVMSVNGYVTKRDLTSIGSFLIMAVLGLFIASLVNIFLASNILSWFITYAVLAVFIGLTAWETQQLKQVALQIGTNADLASRYAIIGSLNLYVSFINMFLSVLRILGDRR